MKFITILFALIGCMPFFGCGSAQTHQSVELGAYAADDAVCVTEAADKDAGAKCLDEYKTKYAVFWADSGVTACAVDGGK